MNTFLKNITEKPRIPFFFKWMVCVFLAGFLVTPHARGEELVDRIVAQVNDDIITLSDVNTAIVPYIEKIKNMGLPQDKEQEALYRVRTEMIDELIANKLTDQVVREKGISVSEKEIDAAVESVKQKNFLTQEQFVDALVNEGATLQEYRKGIREQMLRSRLVNQEVQSKIVITTEDVEAYYKKHADRYAGKEKYQLRSIVKQIPQFADEEETRGVLQVMNDIIVRLEKGESFAELAKVHSDLLAEEGGNIGNFALEDLSPQIKAAVEGLKVGGHTPVMHTPQGLAIFYLENIVKEEGVPLASVSDEINEILYKEVVDQKFKEWVEDLRKNAHIKIIQ